MTFLLYILSGLIFFLVSISSSYASNTAIYEDFHAIIAADFLALHNNKFSQADIDDLFDVSNQGIIRFQIIDNKLYYIDKKILKSSKRVEHQHLEVLSNILSEVLKRHKVQNVDFIISIHDDSEHIKFADELKNPYIPMLVFAKDKTNPAFPIKIPFIDYFTFRWQKFAQEVTSAKTLPENQWQNKENKMFWRGATTGQNYNISNYLEKPRIKLVVLSQKYPELIDAKLTHVIQKDPELADKISSIAELSPNISLSDQLKYKYMIDIDGNTSSFSPWKLLANSVTFKQETNNMQWFYPLLKPWVHYVPVKEDLSDLIIKIEYAMAHDAEMKLISERAQEFASSYLSQESIYAYAAMVLNTYAKYQNFTLQSPSFWTIETDRSLLIRILRDFAYNTWTGLTASIIAYKSWQICCLTPIEEQSHAVH